MNSPITLTRDELDIALAKTSAVAEVVELLGEVTQGDLYQVLGSRMTKQTFDAVVNYLCQVGWVQKQGCYLKWRAL